MKTKLRRMVILALVLVLLCSNTMRASADTGAPSVSVSTYEEFCNALDGASNLDTILINAVIEVPEGAVLGYEAKTVTVRSSGGYLSVVANTEATDPTRFLNLIFDGGGLDLLAPYLKVIGDIEVTGCTFKNCGKNGAVNLRYTEAQFENCTFKDNRGSYGAHMCIGYQVTASFTGCSFTGGVSTNMGGGIYLDNFASTANIVSCIITGNTGSYGGGIASWGTLTVSNTLLYGNTASVGGADLFSAGSYTLESVEDMAELFHNEGLEPLSWDNDYTDLDYGATALKLSYTTYEAPTEPEPTDPPDTEVPDEGNNTGGEDDGTTPPDPDTGDTEEPTTPDGGEEPTDPPTTPPDEGEDSSGDAEDPSDTGKGDTIDNSTTDNSDHSSTDNSQHSSTTDNPSVVSNTDNSSSKSESSNTKNSNNTTTYNYYQTEQDKSSVAPQSISQPITVNVTVPQAKDPETGTQEPTEASQSIAQNIHIEAEGVNVKYEYTEDGVSISISPYKAPESPTAVELLSMLNYTSDTGNAPQEPEKSPNNWLDYATVALLAILVFLELKDRLSLKKCK